MARLLWLAECLRAAGLTVHEVEGWRTRGLDSYGPVVGVTIHETRGSATSTDATEIGVLLNGSATAKPPIAQLYVSRTGHWWVVASGTCNHNKTGWAGPNSGLGNDSLLGIEAQHAVSESWAKKPVQYQSYVRGVAALCARGGWPVARVAGHKEHQPGDKPDPAFDMNRFRSDVAAILRGDNDMPSAADVWNVPISSPALGFTGVAGEWLKYTLEAARSASTAVALLEKIAEKVDLDPAELEAIRQAAREGAASALDPAAIAAAIPDDLAQDVVDLLAARLTRQP